MKIKDSIDRREALKRSAIIMGGVVSAPTILGILNGCAPTNEVAWTPQLFDENQARVITSLVDVIIPSGEIAGAVDVGIPQFIDSMVGQVYDPEAKQVFMEGLSLFIQQVDKSHGKSFDRLESEEQISIVKDMNREMVQSDGGVSFFRYLRELTIVGYCRSEVGATQLLLYDKVPGAYHGCIPLDEVERAWAT